MKIKNLGFTLVELLIVIALIAILSVAVLATINPIEQANKAKDAATQNDAAEVLNAYERYYAGQASYPWVDIFSGTDHLTVDSVAYLNSYTVGAGLCGTADGVSAATDPCTLNYNANKGLLITTTELKDSFLNKGYAGNLTNAPTFENRLYIVKDAASGTSGNSIYVCYIPKANANRTVNSKLVDLKISGTDTNYLPTAYTAATDTDYFTGTVLSTAWSFTTASTSLFKCVP